VFQQILEILQCGETQLITCARIVHSQEKRFGTEGNIMQVDPGTGRFSTIKV
jgi:hypothetical protein